MDWGGAMAVGEKELACLVEKSQPLLHCAAVGVQESIPKPA